MRQRQSNLIPIHGRAICLQWIALEINRLQLLLVLQLSLDLVKAGELVIRCPQLFQILQCTEVLEVGDLVVREVEDTEGGGGFETGEVRDGVVGEVEFFQVWEVGESGDAGEAVGLD
jgi:hypothetical protein